MKSRIGIALFVILFSGGYSSLVRSQQPLSLEVRNAYHKRQIKEAFKEKLHGNLDSLLYAFGEGKHIQPGASEGMPNSSASSIDAPVSSNIPESEIHAAINPTDSNNLVVSAMHVASGLVFPIYYTKDFGQTWKQSTFHPFPYDSRATIAGGGDPVLVYDANGKLYLSWVDLYLLSGSRNNAYEGMYWASRNPANRFHIWGG